jgi:asparagine synthetase B (glutamine-hydrolysing)
MCDLRRLINKHLEGCIEAKDDVAILFSGGMDSLTVLLSCLDVGITPVLYTFYLKSYESEDIKSSRRISDIFGVKLVEVCIDDSDTSILIKDVASIIKRFEVHLKTAVQCIYPFLYVMPAIKEKYVLTGLFADDLYGTFRGMAQLSKDFKAFCDLREELIADLNISWYKQIKELAESYNKTFIAPYRDSEDIINFFRPLSYKEMNSPKLKYTAYISYRDEIDRYRLYRRNSGLQCNSMIREWHDTLLETGLNRNNYKVIAPIYKYIYDLIEGGFEVEDI